MKGKLLAATLLVASMPASAHIWDLKLGTLYNWCMKEDYEKCTAYILGVWHGIEDTDAILHRTKDWRMGQDDPPKTLICVPPSTPLHEIVSTVITYTTGVLKLYPGDKDQPADSMVFAALQRQYPCKR
jgi:Rap1a immunity proteins